MKNTNPVRIYVDILLQEKTDQYNLGQQGTACVVLFVILLLSFPHCIPVFLQVFANSLMLAVEATIESCFDSDAWSECTGVIASGIGSGV